MNTVSIIYQNNYNKIPRLKRVQTREVEKEVKNLVDKNYIIVDIKGLDR